jgi:hypothetical protein
LIGGGRMVSVSALHLFFRDHVQLNAAQKDPGTAKIFEAQHGPGAPPDCPMVLLDERLLRYLDCRISIGVSRSIDRIERAARLAPLLSMVTVSGTPSRAIDFSK